MNDLNPLTYGYLSPTSQSGSGGPSTTKLSATFIFSHMDGTRFYNPICPLEIAKRICVNGFLSKILHLMETNPSMSTLHYLGGRLVLCMAEYGDLAPQSFTTSFSTQDSCAHTPQSYPAWDPLAPATNLLRIVTPGLLSW